MRQPLHPAAHVPGPDRPTGRASALGLALLVTLSGAGCGPWGSNAPAGARPGIEPVESFVGRDVAVLDGFLLTLEVTPARVRSGGSFDAWISVLNTGPENATWTTPYGCLAFLSIYRDDLGIPLEGSTYACTAAFRDWHLAPGELAEMVVTVKAVLEGGRAPPGKYRVVANAFGASLEVPVTVTGDDEAVRRLLNKGRDHRDGVLRVLVEAGP